MDPTLSAFLRSMGVSEQDIYARQRQQQLLSENAFNRQLPVFAEQERSAVQGVLNDAEGRGVLQSGVTFQNATRARNNVLQQREIARGNMMDEQARYNLDAVSQVAELRRRQAEAQFEAMTRQGQAGAESAYGGR